MTASYSAAASSSPGFPAIFFINLSLFRLQKVSFRYSFSHGTGFREKLILPNGGHSPAARRNGVSNFVSVGGGK
jgi:hypothetical protein